MRYYNINNVLVTHKYKHNTIWLAAKLAGLTGWVLRIGGAAMAVARSSGCVFETVVMR